jgi:hypothetical protein
MPANKPLKNLKPKEIKKRKIQPMDLTGDASSSHSLPLAVFPNTAHSTSHDEGEATEDANLKIISKGSGTHSFK